MYFVYLIAVTAVVGVRAYLLDGEGFSEWPNGTYGLIKAPTGCPRGGAMWLEGARTFDTEDSDAHNYFSANVHNVLAGKYDLNDITTEFCMKITTENDTDVVWPRGSYCILKYGQCPNDFRDGSIYWDNDDWRNHNSVSGVLPSGAFNSNTRIDFCCRSDDRPEEPVGLPTSQPFVLFRYGNVCQQVEGMILTEAFVRWDDEDLLNTDTDKGAHPFDDGGTVDHKLHFCHYKSMESIFG